MTRKPIRSLSTPRGVRTLVASLDGPEAKRLLERLLARHPELLPEVAGLAETELRGVAADDVGGRVVSALGSLSIETVWSRSGYQGNDDYLEPMEAGGLLVSETLAPFLADLARRVELGRRGEATEVGGNSSRRLLGQPDR